MRERSRRPTFPFADVTEIPKAQSHTRNGYQLLQPCELIGNVYQDSSLSLSSRGPGVPSYHVIFTRRLWNVSGKYPGCEAEWPLALGRRPKTQQCIQENLKRKRSEACAGDRSHDRSHGRAARTADSRTSDRWAAAAQTEGRLWVLFTCVTAVAILRSSYAKRRKVRI